MQNVYSACSLESKIPQQGEYSCTYVVNVSQDWNISKKLCWYHFIGEWISYNIIRKYFPKSCCNGKSFCENGGDRKEMCNISRIKVFLDNFFVSKDRTIIINAQKQLEIFTLMYQYQQICVFYSLGCNHCSRPNDTNNRTIFPYHVTNKHSEI